MHLVLVYPVVAVGIGVVYAYNIVIVIHTINRTGHVIYVVVLTVTLTHIDVMVVKCLFPVVVIANTYAFVLGEIVLVSTSIRIGIVLVTAILAHVVTIVLYVA